MSATKRAQQNVRNKIVLSKIERNKLRDNRTFMNNCFAYDRISKRTGKLTGKLTVNLLTLSSLLLLVSCSGVPKNVEPIKSFELSRYLGTWYEIARLDHRFERGLSAVTAEYSLRDDGKVRVKNQGFSTEKNEWKDAIGKAKFKTTDDIGHLLVSFFGPFYASYVIFELDDDYQYAFISGNTTKYLWLLSRTPTVDEAIIERFTARASALGFDTSSLIFVDQSLGDRP